MARTATLESNPSTIRRAVNQLSRSEKGRAAMKALLAMLDDGGCSLDYLNQEAVLILLDGAWGAFAGTAREEMRCAVSDE